MISLVDKSKMMNKQARLRSANMLQHYDNNDNMTIRTVMTIRTISTIWTMMTIVIIMTIMMILKQVTSLYLLSTHFARTSCTDMEGGPVKFVHQRARTPIISAYTLLGPVALLWGCGGKDSNRQCIHIKQQKLCLDQLL